MSKEWSKRHLAHLKNNKDYYFIHPFKPDALSLQYAITYQKINFGFGFGFKDPIPNYILKKVSEEEGADLRAQSETFHQTIFKNYQQSENTYLQELCDILNGKIQEPNEITKNGYLKNTTIIKEFQDKVILGFPMIKSMKYYLDLIENHKDELEKIIQEQKQTNILHFYNTLLKKDITQDPSQMLSMFNQENLKLQDINFCKDVLGNNSNEFISNFKHFANNIIQNQLGRIQMNWNYNFFILQKTKSGVKPYKTNINQLDKNDIPILLEIQKIIFEVLPKTSIFQNLKPNETSYKNFLIYCRLGETFKIKTEYYFPWTVKSQYEHLSSNTILFHELINNIPYGFNEMKITYKTKPPNFKQQGGNFSSKYQILKDSNTKVINLFSDQVGVTTCILFNENYYVFEFRANLSKKFPIGTKKEILKDTKICFNNDTPFQILNLSTLDEYQDKPKLILYFVRYCPSNYFELTYQQIQTAFNTNPLFNTGGFGFNNLIKKFNKNLITLKASNNKNFIQNKGAYLKNYNIKSTNNIYYTESENFYFIHVFTYRLNEIKPENLTSSTWIVLKSWLDNPHTNTSALIKNGLDNKFKECFWEIKSHLLEIKEKHGFNLIYLDLYNNLTDYVLHVQFNKKGMEESIYHYQSFLKHRFTNTLNYYISLERFENLYLKNWDKIVFLNEIKIPMYLYMFQNQQGGGFKMTSKKTSSFIKDIKTNYQENFLLHSFNLFIYSYQDYLNFYQNKIPDIKDILKWYLDAFSKLPKFQEISKINLIKYLKIKNNKLNKIVLSKISFESNLFLQKLSKGKTLLVTNLLSASKKIEHQGLIFYPDLLLTNNNKQVPHNSNVSGFYQNIILRPASNFPFFSKELSDAFYINNIVFYLDNLKYLKPGGDLFLENKGINLLTYLSDYFKTYILSDKYIIFKDYQGGIPSVPENLITILDVFSNKNIKFYGEPKGVNKIFKKKLELMEKMRDLNFEEFKMEVLNKEINFEKMDDLLERKYKIHLNEEINNMKELKLPLTASLRKLNEKYSRELTNEFFGFGAFYQKKIIPSNKTGNIDLNIFYKFFDDLKIEKEQRLIQKKENLKIYQETQKYVNIFNKSISNYVSDLNYLPLKISNAFVKAWEIWNTFNFNWEKKKEIKSFHFAELPGQFIISLIYYLRINNLGSLDWKAESLNPWSKEARKIFGNHIFGNEYGIVKNNPGKYIFGESRNNTGDITNIRLLKFYRKLNLPRNLDFITSEAGLGVEENNLEIYQKLDLAQIIAVLGSLGDNTSCVVKHFTPYCNSFPDSRDGTPFFLSIMNLYMRHFKEVYLTKPLTSAAKSGEFYVVAMDGKRIDDKTFEKYLSYLKNFKVNQEIEPVKNIALTTQIYSFLEDITQINLKIINLHNYIYTYYDEFLEDKDLIDEILEKKYEEWVRRYKFKGKEIENFTKSFFR